MAALACRLPCLEQLVLCFNNPAQQFESGHLRALAPLRGLGNLTLVANFPSRILDPLDPSDDNRRLRLCGRRFPKKKTLNRVPIENTAIY